MNKLKKILLISVLIFGVFGFSSTIAKAAIDDSEQRGGQITFYEETLPSTSNSSVEKPKGKPSILPQTGEKYSMLIVAIGGFLLVSGLGVSYYRYSRKGEVK